MIDLQTTSRDEQIPLIDSHYRDELTIRIAKLRLLHKQMGNKPEPWRWVKSLSE